MCLARLCIHGNVRTVSRALLTQTETNSTAVGIQTTSGIICLASNVDTKLVESQQDTDETRGC